MPKAGFKSVTMSDTVYEKFHAKYTAKKEELAMRGITSFSGFITCELAEKLQMGNKK